MQARKKRGNLILAGVLALVAIAAIVAFQMTQIGQPTPPENRPVAEQKR
jgi:hypothetical protein